MSLSSAQHCAMLTLSFAVPHLMCSVVSSLYHVACNFRRLFSTVTSDLSRPITYVCQLSVLKDLLLITSRTIYYMEGMCRLS